jgi:hypothetical protein
VIVAIVSTLGVFASSFLFNQSITPSLSSPQQIISNKLPIYLSPPPPASPLANSFTQPAGDAFNFILDVEGYPASIINLFVVLALFILRYTCPDLHRPFKTWIIVPFFFLIAQGFLLTAPFLRPPGGKGDTSLPYWLYPIVGITVLVVGGTWWLVWRVVWPKLGKFEWLETKASLRDGTMVTEFEKRKVA